MFTSHRCFVGVLVHGVTSVKLTACRPLFLSKPLGTCPPCLIAEWCFASPIWWSSAEKTFSKYFCEKKFGWIGALECPWIALMYSGSTCCFSKMFFECGAIPNGVKVPANCGPRQLTQSPGWRSTQCYYLSSWKWKGSRNCMRLMENKESRKLDGMESSKSKSDAHFMHGWDETNTRTTWATRCGVQWVSMTTQAQHELTRRLRAHSLSSVAFHVLCVGLGFHVVIGVGRLFGFTTHT